MTQFFGALVDMNDKTNSRVGRIALAEITLAVFFGAWSVPLHAMTLNMAVPFSSKPASPQDARLVFWSPQEESLIFSKENEIVIRCQTGLRAVGLEWTLSRNAFNTSFASGVGEPLPENAFVIRIPTRNLKPGFFDLRVKLDSGDETRIPGVCTFGFQIDKIPLSVNRPDDFKKFWDEGKSELSQIPFDPKIGEMETFQGREIDAYNMSHAALPGDYDPEGHQTEEVESCKIDIAGPNGSRIHAWLAKPKGSGPFPAMLILPGAGFNARPRPLEHARHGYLALDIQIHGQPVDLKNYEKLPGYYDNFVFDPPEEYYYRKIYLNALQALEYLFSREDVDKNRVVLAGGSQGGRLAVVLAALEPRVAAAVATITNGGNVPYLEWVIHCNAAKPPTDGMDQDIPPPVSDPVAGHCRSYYDPMNFAPDVKCPILMAAGLIDPISPPASVFPVYDQLGAKEKQMIILPGLGHDWSPEFDRRAWRWLHDRLKLTKAKNPS
ncbi:MAG: acetylxylan esterase [Chthoniobacterales bacterium]|nr:acetylxylan esterase [Chthoniobacterales bacterium]